ncbi:MAG: murein biosynthesis integral membrane protein MurJ [Chloroflexi bacterium]|nr:murein biosynthesis integral membrane protein MurJ [Chloroflexota bacterium]MBU1751157.1 murein biosynthesis integral membrane protein MurJ [Chloroflexota bacterium]
MSARSTRLAGAAALVMVGFVLSRVLGLVREMVIGAAFGTSGALDAYRTAFLLPDILFTLLAGGALASAFIPTFTAYLARDDEETAWSVASSVFNVAALALVVAAGALFVAAPWIVPWVVPGYDPAKQALTVDLVRIMLASPVIFGLSGILMGVLNSYGRFALPALAPAAYNAAIIGGALLGIALFPAEAQSAQRAQVLAVSVSVGSGLHLLVQVPGLVRQRVPYRLVLDVLHPGVREVGRLMAPRVLGLGMTQFNFLVNNVLGSLLAAGSVAALGYAWLLTMMPLGIFAMAISTVVFPTMAELFATDRTDELRGTLRRGLSLILYLTIPASVGLVVLREPLVRLLFQRGEFTAASTEMVAWALGFYALGLFAHATLEIGTRCFYALHNTWTPVLVGVGSVVVNIALSWILLVPLGIGGLALANSLATAGEALVLLWLLSWRLRGIQGRALAWSVGKSTVASLAMGVLVAGWIWVVEPLVPAGLVGNGVLVAGGIALGGLCYAGLTWLLRCEEVQSLLLLATSWKRHQ